MVFDRYLRQGTQAAYVFEGTVDAMVLAESLAAMFLVGLAGGVHCVGMCGAIVAAFAGAGGPQRPANVVTYNGGRIASYALAGAVVGTSARPRGMPMRCCRSSKFSMRSPRSRSC